MDPSAAKFGGNAALTAFVAIVAFGVVQTAQLLGLLTYPADEIAIYATSICIAPPFLVAISAVHATAGPSGRFWSATALAFAGLYTAYALLTYAVQLGSVIPAFPRAAAGASGFVLGMQPHSLFWTLDALAYICMGVSAGFAGLALTREQDRVARRWLLAHAAVTPLICVAYFYPVFSPALLAFGAPWLVTAPGATLTLARMFDRRATEDQ